MKHLFFMLPHCKDCPHARNMLELKGIEFEEIDASTKQGEKQVAKYGIGKVPAVLVLNEKGEIVDSARNVKEIEGLLYNSSY